MLTEVEEMLISGLKAWGCDRIEALVIMVQLYTEESQIALAMWMYEHQDATPLELLAQADRLAPPDTHDDEE
jgi:hypothetical protein